MKGRQRKIISILLIFTLVVSLLSVLAIGASAADGSITDAQGWFESAYAEWTPVSGADGYNAYVAPAGSTNWTKLDSELVRSYSSYYRVDAVGLKAGDYQIKIVPTSGGTEQTNKAMTTSTINVEAYDRSGYAHFNYTEGVGAYNDDGTLKKNAIVIYVTNENKNSVSVTSKDGTTVTGIGNILNSVGMDVGGGKSSKGGAANTNNDILRKLAKDGTPLVVRIIGSVRGASSTNLSSATSEINGLTQYDGVDNGGSTGDNGFMARMSGGKNITIEGIGSDAAIDGWGLHFICQTADYSSGYGRSFEVRNISFKNVPEDCVGMEGQQEGSTLTAPVERCWIHHCTFYAPVISSPAESDKDGGDGACDFKRGQYFTNSYCYYNGYHKTNLVGSSDDSLQYNLTYHHNYWKNCESRGPLARQANIHMYNNVFDGQTSYCMNPRANAYIFSEYNMFYKSKNPVDVDSGAVKSYNDSFASCTGNNNATIVSDRATQVSTSNKYANFDTNSSLSYIPSGNYVIQESIAEMKAVVLAYAGTQKDAIVTPDKVNTSVIPYAQYPTSAVSLDYTKQLNKTNIPSSGTYDNISFTITKFNADYLSVGGSTDSCNIVFYVDTEVDVTITQYSESKNDVVLCNEIGEALLVGSGTVRIPSGYYFIQSNIYDVGSAKYKEAKISGLTIIAVDPNAAPNPITPPTPNPDDNTGGDNGNTGGDNTGDNTGSGDNGNTGGDNTGDNTGSGDNTGGDNGNTGTTLPAGSYTHSFTENGKTDPTGFFTISGNTSTSKGSVTYNNLELTTCLKIESSTEISFTAPTKGYLILVFGGSTNAAGKKIKIDGDAWEIGADQTATFYVSGGKHTITKADSVNLFYMVYYSDIEQHTHTYVEEETTEATCTIDGLLTYTCECGDSYTEIVPASGHDFVDGFCTNCGIDDPEYKDDSDGGEGDDNDGDNPDGGDNGESGGNDSESGGNTDDTPDNGETSDNGEAPTDTKKDHSKCLKEKSGWKRFWNSIANFFRRLFNPNVKCVCGEDVPQNEYTEYKKSFKQNK